MGYLLTLSGTDQGVVEETFGEVLGLVEGLRLGNESVWVFLRTLAGDGRVVREGLYERFEGVRRGVMEGAKTEGERKVLRAAGEWSEAYRGRHDDSGV